MCQEQGVILGCVLWTFMGLSWLIVPKSVSEAGLPDFAKRKQRHFWVWLVNGVTYEKYTSYFGG